MDNIFERIGFIIQIHEKRRMSPASIATKYSNLEYFRLRFTIVLNSYGK